MLGMPGFGFETMESKGGVVFVVMKAGLYWIGGGWSNAEPFVFTRIDLAHEIAAIVGGRVAELWGRHERESKTNSI